MRGRKAPPSEHSPTSGRAHGGSAFRATAGAQEQVPEPWLGSRRSHGQPARGVLSRRGRLAQEGVVVVRLAAGDQRAELGEVDEVQVALTEEQHGGPVAVSCSGRAVARRASPRTPRAAGSRSGALTSAARSRSFEARAIRRAVGALPPACVRASPASTMTCTREAHDALGDAEDSLTTLITEMKSLP